MNQLFFTILCFFFTVSWSQEKERLLLTDHIETDCPQLYLNDCSGFDLSILDEKFIAAEDYLVAELKKLQIADSSSFYDEKKTELNELERASNKKKYSKSDKLKSEQLYLLLSVLKPYKSGDLFLKLIGSYLNAEIKNVNPNKLESTLYYKHWLFKLLDNRFKGETRSFEKQDAALFYNQVVRNYTAPFQNVDSEKIFLEKLKNWTKLATHSGKVGYSYEELISLVYDSRIIKFISAYNLNRSTELFNFIEKSYSEALSISPNNTNLKYNFGIFYNNEALFLSNDPLVDSSIHNIEQRQQRIEELSTKAGELFTR